MTTLQKRKLWISASACLSILVIALTALDLFLPSQYVSIDVNPSIELKLNRLGRVVEIKGANEDAQALLDGYVTGDRSADTVLAELTALMIEKGYLAPDKANNILITMAEGSSAAALDTLCAKVNLIMASHNMRANVTGQIAKITPETVKVAEENAMSAGKMSIIKRLIAADASLTPEELLQISVGDLISYAGNAGIPLRVMEDYLDAAEDILGDAPDMDAMEDGLDDDAAEEAAEAEDATEEAAEVDEDAREQAEEAAEKAAEALEDAREQAEDDSGDDHD